MKYIFYFLIITLAVSVSAQTSHPKTGLFTLQDAEKILGEQAHLADSKVSSKDKISVYQYTYTAHSADLKTGKTGAIYVMIEEYSEIESARKTYSDIIESNRKNGINELKDLGDEAYFHTDKQNFYFILVRKGNRMLRMKVNKITSLTSLDEFNNVARKITAAM